MTRTSFGNRGICGHGGHKRWDYPNVEDEDDDEDDGEDCVGGE